MKPWHIDTPTARCSISFALLLAFSRLIPAFLVLVPWVGHIRKSFLVMGSAPTPFSSPFAIVLPALIWTIPGIVWGAYFGRTAGRAYEAWTREQFENAKSYCGEAAFFGLLLNGAWTGCVLFVISRDTSSWALPRILFYLAFNTCLQASALMWIAHCAIRPNPVQVTKDVRL